VSQKTLEMDKALEIFLLNDFNIVCDAHWEARISSVSVKWNSQAYTTDLWRYINIRIRKWKYNTKSTI